MNTCICKEVIVSTLTRRGKGVKHDPIRIITEVFEKDGTLIAENDPTPGTYALFDLIDFARWCITNGTVTDEVTPSDVEKWLDVIERQ
jgi:hypothetical protein